MVALSPPPALTPLGYTFQSLKKRTTVALSLMTSAADEITFGRTGSADEGVHEHQAHLIIVEMISGS
jgi:hypothetical protein